MTRAKLFILMALLGSASIANSTETYILKLNHFLPSTASPQRKIFEPWCAKIKEESAGRLECQIYPSMQLGGTPAKLADMARNGVADIVWTAPSYSPGKFPRIEALEQPFLLPYGAKASNPIIWNFYEKYAKADFKDYKVLAVHGDGGMGFHSNRQPITSMSDLNGMKLRASNRASSMLVESLGAVPVSMPPAQMTESLSKGVIDGVLYTWASIREVKVDEVTKFHSQPPSGSAALSNTVLTLLMNKKTFNKLPSDLQDIIEKNSGPTLNNLISERWDNDINDSITATSPDKIVYIKEQDYKAMQKAAEPVVQNWVKEVSEKGIDGNTLLQGLREMTAAQIR